MAKGSGLLISLHPSLLRPILPLIELVLDIRSSVPDVASNAACRLSNIHNFAHGDLASLEVNVPLLAVLPLLPCVMDIVSNIDYIVHDISSRVHKLANFIQSLSESQHLDD